MAFWDKFKKKTPPVINDDPHVLAGIPMWTPEPEIEEPEIEESEIEMGLVAPNPDAENSFIYPPPHQSVNADWVQTYPLVFYLMEDNVCTRKIDYVCYTGQKPADILSRMIIEDILPEKAGISYRILYWPTRNGKSTVDHLDDSEPLLIQDFNPKPGSVFIIEQYRKVEASMPLYTLYGCPTAVMPEQENSLRHPCVDTVSYD